MTRACKRTCLLQKARVLLARLPADVRHQENDNAKVDGAKSQGVHKGYVWRDQLGRSRRRKAATGHTSRNLAVRTAAKDERLQRSMRRLCFSKDGKAKTIAKDFRIGESTLYSNMEKARKMAKKEASRVRPGDKAATSVERAKVRGVQETAQ